jgi:membrane fusion protein, heavy metal efflux system
MKTNFSWVSRIPALWWRRGAVIAGTVLILLTLPWLWAGLESLADGIAGSSANAASKDQEASASKHGDGQGAPSITLSEQARKNFRRKEAKLESYARFLTLPALVVERPGESRYQVVAPFTGIVTGLDIVPGKLVESSDRLFTLRLTHEDLVKAQKEFLITLGKLDVERRELVRLEKIDSSLMARKILLEKQYQIEILEADLKAQRNALHLHGLSKSEIEKIETERTLVRELTISVPFLHHDASVHSDEESERTLSADSPSPGDHELVKQEFLVEDLDVEPGQAVETGQTLCHLTNYQMLYIEGRAFEQDGPAILKASQQKFGVQAIPEGYDAETSILKNLKIDRIANRIETDSRALHFYVELPNQLEEDFSEGEQQFAVWRYKPGQRMQLRVPVEVFEDVFVLPVDAIAQEGVENYVFVENGNNFKRRSVHVLYRDQSSAVIGKGGGIFPQESIVQNAAHQLLLAIKSQSSGDGGGEYHIHADGTRHKSH